METRKRPQFFIDLERENAGESVKEPLLPTVQEDAEIRVQTLQELWQGQAALSAMQARCAQVESETRLIEEFSRLRGIENRTATGAMIAANQYWERAQMMAQDPYGQRAYMAQQQASADSPYRSMGPIWNSFGGLFGGLK